MKRYAAIAAPVAFGCILFSTIILILSVIVATLESFNFAGGLMFHYFQKLNLPMLSLILPVVGMLALLPLALRLAFGQEAAEPVFVPASPAVKTTLEPAGQHLKAA